MELALYGELGFYMRVDGGSAGRRGDFITSPEVGPLFGVVIGRYLDAEWERLGRPDPFTVRRRRRRPRHARPVDPGRPSGLPRRAALRRRRDLRRAARSASRGDRVAGRPPAGAVRRGHPRQRAARQPAVPSRRVRRGLARGVRRRRPVRAVRRGPVGTARSRPARGCRRTRLSAPGHRSSIAPPRSSPTRAALLRRGTLLCIDYGVPRTGELAMRPWREWLRTYRSNERGGHYLDDPGGQDITVDVPFDQLPEPDAVRSQSQFLQRWGIDELVDEGVRGLERAGGAARPRGDADAQPGAARPKRCSTPSGLGGFHVAEWRRRLTPSSADRLRTVRARPCVAAGESEEARTTIARMAAAPDAPHDTIDALSAENRKFPPSEAFKADALVVGHATCTTRRRRTTRRSGRSRRPNWSTGSSRGTPRSTGSSPTPAGSTAARSTCRTTASTATCSPATATASRSTGRASPATRARSPTPNCSTRCAGSPTCSRRSGSPRATGSTSTCR